MSNSIEFYFDFSSPYGYLGAQRIKEVADKHNRVIDWHPVLLGAIFKVSGQAPLVNFPLKGDYAIMDFQRSAREVGLPYAHPENFPIGAVAASRAVWWAKENTERTIQSKTTDLVQAIFKAYYVDGQDISNAEVVLNIADGVGLDKAVLTDALQDQAVKDRLKSAVSAAIEKKVFGSPMMIVDGESFWGNDRIEQLDRWLTRGGW